ncbi:MAG TPA: SPOR domain-containing protein [Gemmatimonadales bacterium]|nr:SPOR domain-containing protein [Gemmatimonadales bacterium]
MNRRRAVLAAAGALTALHQVAAAQAQLDPRLQAAVTLAQAGRTDSARTVVRRLLTSLSPQDSIYPEALYVQGGMLASDPQSAATSLQRVVVEYGRSSWADDALLRLSQLYEAQNDPASAIQSVERLRRDYPDSPLLPRAAFVGARSAFDLRDEGRGCSYIRDALAGAGDDIEFKNQVGFYSERCQASSTSVAATSTSVDTQARRATGRFGVQVLMGKSAPQIDDMLNRLKTLGYAAHVVRDSSGYMKVRVGPYPTRDAAQRAQGQLKTRFGGQPFLVEEP